MPVRLKFGNANLDGKRLRAVCRRNAWAGRFATLALATRKETRVPYPLPNASIHSFFLAIAQAGNSMDPGRPSAPVSCAVHAPIGGNAAAPFPWMRSSPWPRCRLMAAHERSCNRQHKMLQPMTQIASTGNRKSFKRQTEMLVAGTLPQQKLQPVDWKATTGDGKASTENTKKLIAGALSTKKLHPLN